MVSLPISNMDSGWIGQKTDEPTAKKKKEDPSDLIVSTHSGRALVASTTQHSQPHFVTFSVRNVIYSTAFIKISSSNRVEYKNYNYFTQDILFGEFLFSFLE